MAVADVLQFDRRALLGIDGRVLALSGQITSGVFADVPELYDAASNTVTSLSAVRTTQLREDEYPQTSLLPSGQVMSISAEHGAVQLLTVGSQTWTK